MPLTLGERFWIEQLSRGQAKTHSPLTIRGFLWGRNRNSEKEFMELGRYKKRLKESFNQEERGENKVLQKRRERSPAMPAGSKMLKYLFCKKERNIYMYIYIEREKVAGEEELTIVCPENAGLHHSRGSLSLSLLQTETLSAKWHPHKNRPWEWVDEALSRKVGNYLFQRKTEATAQFMWFRFEDICWAHSGSYWLHDIKTKLLSKHITPLTCIFLASERKKKKEG